jgi:hypothetical protein
MADPAPIKSKSSFPDTIEEATKCFEFLKNFRDDNEDGEKGESKYVRQLVNKKKIKNKSNINNSITN